jgi:hypothetical protein
MIIPIFALAVVSGLSQHSNYKQHNDEVNPPCHRSAPVQQRIGLSGTANAPLCGSFDIIVNDDGPPCVWFQKEKDGGRSRGRIQVLAG